MRIGTRGSALALWQARTVARLVRERGGPEAEIVIIRTSGDEASGPPDAPRAAAAVLPAPPAGAAVDVNVKRAFVKEIEDALLAGRIDVAVHSAKDLPAELPDGLRIAAALEREDPRDALLLPASPADQPFASVQARLGVSPRLGTSSVRRAAQLRRHFPGASFVPIRGNVDTRLRKLDGGACDALVLAAAGVRRLGLGDRLTALLPQEVCLSAPGQGIVAVEVSRDCPPAIAQAVARLADADADAALAAERAVVRALGGNCQMPLGVLAVLDGRTLTVHGVVAAPGGEAIVRATVTGQRGGAAAAGEKLAAHLIAEGAGALLK